mgnify:CR=1 FL=1
MEHQNSIKFKILTFISFLCLTIPFTIYFLWFYVFDLGTTQAERVLIFKSYFPDFLHGRWSTTILSIIFSAIAVVLSGTNLKQLKNGWKFINIILLVFSCILLFLNLFSMM